MFSDLLGQSLEIFFNFGWFIFLSLIALGFKEFWMVRIVTNYIDSIEWVVLEMKIPRENIKSIKSMEQVFAAIYGIYSFGLRPWEKYVEGKVEMWISFEMVGDQNGVHFYVRLPKQNRNLLENAIFSQYPDAELHEVEDYVNRFPKVLPNDEYDLFGSDFILQRNEAYPIRTYIDFEDLRVKEEEDKIDPVAVMTEALSRLEEGEVMWVQLIVRPADEDEWVSKAKAVIDEEAGRTQKGKKQGVIAGSGEFLGNLAKAPMLPPEWAGVADPEKPTFRFYTPGETEALKAMSRKASKRGFHALYRTVYIDRKPDFNPKHYESFVGAIQLYTAIDMNMLKPATKETLTKGTKVSRFPWRRKKLLLRRKRLLYKAYLNREIPQPHIPSAFRLKLQTSIFNTEELASIYHPPAISVRAPKLRPTQFKKGEPPVDLPIKG